MSPPPPPFSFLLMYLEKDILSNERGFCVERWQLAGERPAAIVAGSFQRRSLRLLHHPHLSTRHSAMRRTVIKQLHYSQYNECLI